MSISARNWAWRAGEHLELSAPEAFVLAFLAEMENAEEGCAFPSQETIAARTRQSDRNVRTVIRRLEERKLLRVEKRRRKGGDWARSEYFLAVPHDFRESDPEWLRHQG
ncbi:helix-turn-helix domain-containing protein [Rathayibacter sp. AY1C5]|uniref:helix-turn-helix domain-containing protein n=1 Tax=Rathayibacter sp. AY1C5 TaxID=2080538 RepID=UPI000CE8D4BD|nr:helix-turn-helix domain-containing protein [Rathayibacter sp. AY1C5]PPG61624.1 hypothetical protein C5C57_00920 [Rathayibacter sp. AY1C5]